MTDSITISRQHRPDIRAGKLDDGTIVIRCGRAWLQVDEDDLRRLYRFSAGRPSIARYPVMAPHSALSATETGE
jgi:hypothetical protein